MSGLLVFFAGLMTLVFIYATLATILNLEAGWGGLLDLGTAGLLAAGAYTYVILTVDNSEIAFAPGLPIWAGMIGASLFTGLLAFLIGIPALRLRGEHFLITTFALSIVIIQFITTESHLTLGASGFHNISRPFDQWVSTRNYNFVLLALAAIGWFGISQVVYRLGRSPFGRVLRAQRDNEAAAKSVGKNIAKIRLQSFVMVGMLIGLAAPVYVWFIRSLEPHLFHVTLSFTVWTALVIGGMGSYKGPTLGALILVVLTESLQFLQVSPDYAVWLASARPIVIGLALILIMRISPQGLIPETVSFVGSRKLVDKQKP